MRKMVEWYNKMPTILKNEKGQSMVEYALLLILIALVVVAAIPSISQKISEAYGAVANKLTVTP